MSSIVRIGDDSFDMSRSFDISIPLRFDGPQPNAYGVPPATSEACVSGDLVGDTRRGGSCNFESYTLIPHCIGTHTECVGHITNERISVSDSLRDAFVPTVLISVAPEPLGGSGEDYTESGVDADLVITWRQIEQAVRNARITSSDSLVVRTLPNEERKLSRVYGDSIPPYFSLPAMRYIVEIGVRHLLVDLPSIDRMYDDGRLLNHRTFWKVEPGRFELTEIARRTCTITELIYVPNNVEDGRYLLNLQIAPFAADASPSRPILFPVIKN